MKKRSLLEISIGCFFMDSGLTGRSTDGRLMMHNWNGGWIGSFWVAAFLAFSSIYAFHRFRRRRRKQMRKKMQDAFEQQYFGQYNQAVDPGYGQRQSMMGGQLYDYPSPQVDNMTSQFAAPAPPAAPPPPPPPPGPKPAQVKN